MRDTTAGNLPEESTSVRMSRSDARYWKVAGRVFHDHGAADYSCRFSLRGERNQVCLNTPNKHEAAKRAAKLFNTVSQEGWQAGLALYRSSPTKDESSKLTVGAYIRAAVELSSARSQSIHAYTKALRKIVSDIKGITSIGKHSEDWRELVDAVELETIAPSDVIAWKNKRLRDAEADPLAKQRAVVTVNSLIRNAKSLFGKRILPFVDQSLKLPSLLPFDGVTLEKAPSMRYVSKIDPYALLATAKEELSESDPEAFKVLILALVCGLRRSEIDNLLWRAIDFPGSVLRVETSEYHQLKSEDSAGEIDLDADTLVLFRSYRAKHPKSIFVIESSKQPINRLKSRRYRCDAVFKKLLAWLQGQGVEGNKPIHTLRKEIGSIIASEHGIFAASRYLRHSDIRITSAIYADKKHTVVPKAFAGLLGNQAQVKDKDQSESPQDEKV
jgi:integrase